MAENPACILPPRRTFESFVTCENNEFAHALARAVAKGEGPILTFLFGGCGHGKTHLLTAACHFFCEGGLKGAYQTAEWFTNDYLRVVGKREDMAAMRDFRTKLRGLDLLVIDEIEFFVGKEKTTEEFLHTLNERYERGLPTLLGSVEHPGFLKFPPALVSRLRAACIAEVGLPDDETRVGIVMRKAEGMGFQLNRDWASMIVKRTRAVRYLEGELFWLRVHVKNLGRALDADLISRPSEGAPVTPEEIIDVVANHCGISKKELLDGGRKAHLAMARWAAMQAMRELVPGISSVEIGRVLGGMDHSSVLNGLRKDLSKMEGGARRAPDVQAIVRQLRRA